MSFRLFVYYCAVCGGWAALLGWLFGRIPGESIHPVVVGGFKGMWLGLAVAFVLGILDAVWNFSLQQMVLVVPRIACAAVVGSVGGLACGLVGTAVYRLVPGVGGAWIQVVGWTCTGLLIGSSLALYELIARLAARQDLRGAVRKMLHCLVGGTMGGFLGGVLLVGLGRVLFQNKVAPWSPGAIGFVVLGGSIGLMIGLSQVLLREAWVRVEEGFRPGRELIIGKAEWTIGRAEGCDLGLFGDNQVERRHARILREGDRYLVVDDNTPAGTFLNDRRITGPTPLRSGDRIRVGRHVLLFGERPKRSA